MAIPNQALKRCNTCRRNKPTSEFYTRKPAKPHWKVPLHPYCKTCTKTMTRRRYVEKRDAILAQGKQYMRDKRARIKAAVFAAYGGYVCACCGETEPLFLTIDHVNNDGAAHRRSIAGRQTAGGYQTYQWLARHGFPPGFQVLCASCQHGKRMNGGVCPHQRRRNDQGKPVGASAPKCRASLTLVRDEEMVSPTVETGSSRKAELA